MDELVAALIKKIDAYAILGLNCRFRYSAILKIQAIYNENNNPLIIDILTTIEKVLSSDKKGVRIYDALLSLDIEVRGLVEPLFPDCPITFNSGNLPQWLIDCPIENER